MTMQPTGRREARGGRDSLVLERTFKAAIESVWSAITVSDRMEQWIGAWTGDPATGSVEFRMTAEGDDIEAETFTIDACEPPRLLAVSTNPGDDEQEFALVIELVEETGTTTLVFSQPISDPEQGASIAPGWEYYLDRLVAAVSGSGVEAIDFDHYYPAQADHYRSLFS